MVDGRWPIKRFAENISGPPNDVDVPVREHGVKFRTSLTLLTHSLTRETLKRGSCQH